MSIHWKLKALLSQKYSIYNATSFQKRIVNKTGIIISLPNVSKMLKEKPKLLRLETMEIICSTLDCKLSDFMEVKPKVYKTLEQNKKLSYKNTPHSKRAIKSFPSPVDYK